MTNYDWPRQTFCFSALADMSSYFSGPAETIASQMQTWLDEVFADGDIQNMIGPWKRVWGPVVVVNPIRPDDDNLAINTMFIAQNGDDFTVGIAGTNSKSWFDWLVEDFWVSGTVTWPFLPAGASVSPQISRGTHYGLQQLMCMHDDGLSARDFLMHHISSGSLVSVTGHSLGGALSPAYALYLADTAKVWDSSGQASLKVLPVAGPTPGDEGFAEYYRSRLDAVTTRVWNELDVVPHAWDKPQLDQIPNLFAPNIKPDFLLKAAVEVAKFISRNTDYEHIQQVAGRPSHVVTESGGTIKEFMQELLYQHINHYITIFDVADFAGRVSDIIGKPFWGVPVEETVVRQTEGFTKTVQAKAQQFNIPLD